ncbi:MAG TPA: serine--tRNA ligase, partial [Chitinophagaceae bacterium]|nr:serine--tRNA ligase [Chitinophagaceae bacterium]
MLQVTTIRQNPDWVKERLALKNFTDIHLVDELLKWDEKRKQYQFENDQLNAKIKSASREIGDLMKG